MKEVSMEVLNVQMVDINKVVANDSNPNQVAKPEMKLLERSIIDNGFCMPIICIYDKKMTNMLLLMAFIDILFH